MASSSTIESTPESDASQAGQVLSSNGSWVNVSDEHCEIKDFGSLRGLGSGAGKFAIGSDEISHLPVEQGQKKLYEIDGNDLIRVYSWSEQPRESAREEGAPEINDNDLARLEAFTTQVRNASDLWKFCQANYGLPSEHEQDFCAAIDELVSKHGFEIETEWKHLIGSLEEINDTGEVTLTDDALRRYNDAEKLAEAGPSWKTVGLLGLLGVGAAVLGTAMQNVKKNQQQEVHA